MPRAPVRPTAKEVDEIDRTLMESDLSPADRRRLRAVREWARGKTSREVAAMPALAMSDYTVCRVVRLYRAQGLAAFTHPARKGPGIPRVAADKLVAVAEELRQSIQAGNPLTYRALSAKHGVSVGTVARIAKEKSLDAGRRRGAVAPAVVR